MWSSFQDFLILGNIRKSTDAIVANYFLDASNPVVQPFEHDRTFGWLFVNGQFLQSNPALSYLPKWLRQRWPSCCIVLFLYQRTSFTSQGWKTLKEIHHGTLKTGRTALTNIRPYLQCFQFVDHLKLKFVWTVSFILYCLFILEALNNSEFSQAFVCSIFYEFLLCIQIFSGKRPII